jgi:hypothetical protein
MVTFYGRMGGMVPMPDDILARIQALSHLSQVRPAAAVARHCQIQVGDYEHSRN